MKDKQKAIAGFLTPLVSWIVMHYGLDMPPATQAAVVTILTGLVVYFVPNVEASK